MRTFAIIVAILLSISLSACSPDDEKETLPPVENPDTDSGGQDEPDVPSETNNRMKMTIGTTSFTATFADNQTTTAFKAMLPMTVHMNEMNGNEKYFYLPKGLPISVTNQSTISNGDIMIYGSDCLVLFYKTFATSYRYTRIGRVDDPTNLEAALGDADVFVKFELITNK